MIILYYAAGVILDLLAILVFIALILHGYFIGENVGIFTGVVNATVWFPVALACSAMVMEASYICKRKSKSLGLWGLK